MGVLDGHRPERRRGQKDERFEGALAAVGHIPEADQPILGVPPGTG